MRPVYQCGGASARSSGQMRLRAGGLPRWAQALLLAARFFHGASLPAQSLPNAIQAYHVKAAYLYNLAKFVNWPEEPEGVAGPLVIVVFGADPVGPALEHLAWGKTINGRRLAVRRTKRVEEVLPCHILFIGSPDRKRLGQIFQAIGNASVLTVSDTEEFLQLGGTVGFVVEGSTVRLRINIEVTERAGLKISSKLLSLAKAVRN